MKAEPKRPQLAIGLLGVLLLVGETAVGQAAEVPPGTAQETLGGKMTSSGLWITDRAEELKLGKRGRYVHLEKGRLLCVAGNTAYLSQDQGKTWEKCSTLVEDDVNISVGVARDILCTKKGTVIVPFSNGKAKKWTWTAKLHDAPGAVLPTYVVRSPDGGKTWLKPQKLHDDWTGDNSAIIQTASGRVVLASMKLLHNPGRHTVLTYYSDDEGETWQKSHVLDLGGRGHHDGMKEAALVELEDGRLWMLVRTNWGVFWNAFSNDAGASWRTIHPSEIDASSSPGFLRRLASGRIALVWNRYRPENVADYPLRGGDGQLSDVPASWHRGELSIAFTDDEGKTWTDPVVIARKPKGNVSYPCVFEVEPGRLWVFANEGLQVALNESDFVAK